MILFFISIFISSSFYYCISDIVIYSIYIALMRKRCQLIKVAVDVDVGSSNILNSVQSMCLCSEP